MTGAEVYQSVILERSRRPQFRRDVSGAVSLGRCSNPLCGDEVAVELRLGVDGLIEDAGFSAEGCAILLASADLMIESVIGTRAALVGALGEGFDAMLTGGAIMADQKLACFAPLHDYPARRRCAILPWEALAQALAQASNGEAP